MSFTKKLSDIREEERAEVCQRALDLATASQHRILIPQAFVVLASAFDTIVRENNLKPKIDFLLQHVKTSDPQSLMNVYTSVRRIIATIPLPKDLESELREMFATITAKGTGLSDQYDPARIIVSTSGPEDPESNDTIIQNVHGIDEFLVGVREAWALAFLPSQLRYRMIGRYDEKQLRIALIVEAMPSVTASIHAYSAIPQDHEKIYLQIYYGYPDLRERIVKDYYAIGRDGLQIVDAELATQPSKLELQGPDMILVQLPVRAKDDKLNRREIEEVARLTKKLHTMLESPVKAFFSWTDGRTELLWVSRLPFSTQERRSPTMGSLMPPAVEVVELAPHVPEPVAAQQSAKEAIEEASQSAEKMEEQITADATKDMSGPGKLLAVTMQLAMRAIERRHQQIYGQTGDEFGTMIEQLNSVNAFPRRIDAELLVRVHQSITKGTTLAPGEYTRAAQELSVVLG